MKTERCKFYGWAAWHKGLRPACLARDVMCVVCMALYERGEIHRPEFSTEVDHVVAHNGDAKLFFCGVQGLQGLCKKHHSEKTARDEGRLEMPVKPLVPTGEPGKQFTAGGPSDEEFERLMADVLSPRS